MASVESLSTLVWRALNADEKFRRYLEALGLPAHGNPDRIKQRLNREHSTAWNEFRAVAERRAEGDMSDDVYALKNRNLSFSLLVTASERGELHAKAFSAIQDISDPVSSILDVGCENGFFTCLLALRWPDAKVVGVDPSDLALERARELAMKLNVKNVTFVAGSAEGVGGAVGEDVFDLITTVTVLHDGDLFPSMEGRHARTSEFFAEWSIESAPPAFTAIAKTLAPRKGRWVAIERCQSPALYSIWCQTLDLVSLGVNWRESRRLPCEKTLLTVLVAGHDQPRPLDLRKVHGLWLSPDFNQWTLPGEPVWSIRDQQAEAIFAQLGPKTCIDRMVGLDAAGVEIHRIEVWESGPLALFYMAVHPSACTHLQLRAITDLAAMREHWKSTTAEMRSNAPPGARIEEFHLGA